MLAASKHIRSQSTNTSSLFSQSSNIHSLLQSLSDVRYHIGISKTKGETSSHGGNVNKGRGSVTKSYRLKGKWFLQCVQWTDLDRSHRQESYTEHSSLMLVCVTIARWIASNPIFAQETNSSFLPCMLSFMNILLGEFWVLLLVLRMTLTLVGNVYSCIFTILLLSHPPTPTLVSHAVCTWSTSNHGRDYGLPIPQNLIS